MIRKYGKDKGFLQVAWPGWLGTMESYARRESFQRQWNAIQNEFSPDFQDHMDNLIREQGELIRSRRIKQEKGNQRPYNY